MSDPLNQRWRDNIRGIASAMLEFIDNGKTKVVAANKAHWPLWGTWPTPAWLTVYVPWEAA